MIDILIKYEDIYLNGVIPEKMKDLAEIDMPISQEVQKVFFETKHKQLPYVIKIVHVTEGFYRAKVGGEK